MNIQESFPFGVLRPELLMGRVYTISANSAQVSLTDAGAPSGSHYHGSRYGKGEVGEFVIIEGQVNLVLGRVVEVKKNENALKIDEALGRIHLLGSICMETLEVTAGIESYPRLGDQVYAAPHRLVAMIPELMDKKDDRSIVLNIGYVDTAHESMVKVTPEKMFGRHLAILGSTGGGKSWTTAKVIEESLQFNSKLILFDATGEYRNMENENIFHAHLSSPIQMAENSCSCFLQPNSFQESDFIALFEPAGKVQGPKFKEAIKSLRLASLCPDIFPDGYIKKINQKKADYEKALSKSDNAAKIDDPSTSFNVNMLSRQIEQECVWPNGYNNPSSWGKEDGNFAHCLSLVTRIHGILKSPAFDCVFKNTREDSLIHQMKSFLNSEKKLFRIDLSGIPFEYKARQNIFRDKPVIVFLDEAHNFIGKNIGSEDTVAKLDAFELVAKEGRKFGLNICLATQRPRDVSETVLSQVGTMIVHRITNDRDRDIIERACGEIDKAASAFLPNLKPGEAAIIGNDFPIPLTVQISSPDIPPKSAGPNYQDHWKKNQTIN